MIVDDDRVQFGTLNLDAWAPYRNFEIELMVDDADVAESGVRQGGLDRVRNWFSDQLTDFLERFDHPSVSLPLAE